MAGLPAVSHTRWHGARFGRGVVTRMTGDTSYPMAHYPGLRTLFFVVGVQKASTTWLAEMLAASAGCHVARGKEMHYWTMIDRGEPGPDTVALRQRQVREIAGEMLRSVAASPSRALAAYGRLKVHRTVLGLARDPSVESYVRRLMRGWRGEPVAGELTPTYCLVGRQTYQRMAALGRDVRFVLVMRDPVARLLSGIRHTFQTDARDPEVVRRDIEAGFARALADPTSMHYRLCDYRSAIEVIESAVPGDRIAYFFHETIRQPDEMRRLAGFLGLADIPSEAGRRINSSRADGVRLSPAIEKAARETFAPTYDYVAERFADAVPRSWYPAAAAA